MKKGSGKFFKIAIEEGKRGMDSGDGGPFGAVIVRNGEVIATAHNEVIGSNDPTAHAEILAIRRASEKLGKFDLSDCVIYSTCEPCPMCFSAIHWAKMEELHFGCGQRDAAEIGFDDKFIYDVIRGASRDTRLESRQEFRDECMVLFHEWEKKQDKVRY